MIYKYRFLIPALLLVSLSQVSAQVNLVTIDGTKSSVASAKIENGFLITPSDKVDINELRLVDWNREEKKSKSSISVQLKSGGVLFADTLSAGDDSVKIGNVAGELAFGVESIASIRFQNGELPLFDSLVAKEDLDVLVVKIEGNFQSVPGIIESINDQKVRIIYDEDPIEFKREDAFGLIFANGGDSKKPRVNSMVYLSDGSTVGCLLTTLAESGLTGSVNELTEIKLPLQVISKIELRSNRMAFLSDLEPTSQTQLDDSVLIRKPRKDKNIYGQPLALRDPQTRKVKHYSKGLGTKSGTRIEFANEGFDRLVGLVGIDAGTKGSGDCTLVVLGDGEKLLELPVKGSDAPKVLDVKIAGKSSILLQIDYGVDFLDLSDHLNLCDARFVKDSTE